jgi:hypothetical protein
MIFEKEYVCTWCGQKYIKRFKYPSEQKYFEKQKNKFCCRSHVTLYRNSVCPSGMLGKEVSKETRQKISKANTGQKTGFAVTSKEMNERQKELKTGFHDSLLQSDLSKRGNKSNGGQATFERYRKEKELNSDWYKSLYEKKKISGMKLAEISRKYWKNKYVVDNIAYDSKFESKFAQKLLDDRYITSIQEGVNHQIRVGNKWYDFLINDIFVELHPYDFQGRTDEEYYRQRKENLEKHNFYNKLLVVKDFLEFEEKWMNNTIREQ